MKKNTDLNTTSLLVLGDFAWDVLIRTNSELLSGGDTFGEVLFSAGGSAANTAVWAKRCGLPTTFIGKIGRDRFGRLAEENLEWEKVDAHLIKTDQHRTAAVAVWIDNHGQRSMVSGRGADFYLMSSELPKNVIKKADHLHLTAWSLFTDPPQSAALLTANIVKKNGGTVSFDPASFQIIEEIGRDKCLKMFKDISPDIIFPNYREGRALTNEESSKDIVMALAEKLPQSVIILKMGNEGSLVWDGENTIHIPSVSGDVIDETGAGDSFAGAFLSDYLQSGDAAHAARYAAKIAAWVVSRIGGRPHGDNQLNRILKY